MAKGNIGNLVQHFVALRVTNSIIRAWAQPDNAIEYIDCYSMGVWENLVPLQTPQRAAFLEKCNNFPAMEDDLVASTFLQAWGARHGQALPENVENRQYPNTAFLIRTAFQQQLFRMRLHDVFTVNYDQLVRWGRAIGPEFVRVARDWTQSALIHGCPASTDRPTIVMLDPYRIVSNDHGRANDDGYLREGLIEYLIGHNALAVHPPLQTRRSAPLAVILCSYSEANPDVPNQIVENIFRVGGWSVEKLAAGPFPDVGNVKSHVVWVASFGCSVPILGVPLKQAWDEWF